MIDLPATVGTPLVRTDYSAYAAWQKLIGMVHKPCINGFLANVQIVEDSKLAGIA